MPENTLTMSRDRKKNICVNANKRTIQFHSIDEVLKGFGKYATGRNTKSDPNGAICDNSSSLDDFPVDLFTGMLFLCDMFHTSSFNATQHSPLSFHRYWFSSPFWLLAEEQRLQGAIILHIFAAIYLFTLLSVVCNDYFLPSVEYICEDLSMPKV